MNDNQPESETPDTSADPTRQRRMCTLFIVALIAAVALVFIAAAADCIRVGSFDAIRASAFQLIFLGVVLGMVMSPFFVFASIRKRPAIAIAAIYGPVVLALIAKSLTTGQAMGGHVAVGVVYLLACILVDRFLPNVRDD